MMDDGNRYFEDVLKAMELDALLDDEFGYDDSEISDEAQELLDSGVPIFYSDDDFPGEMVKEYPDGRREIVAMDKANQQYVVREIGPRENRGWSEQEITKLCQFAAKFRKCPMMSKEGDC